jgi:hypothetical protein
MTASATSAPSRSIVPHDFMFNALSRMNRLCGLDASASRIDQGRMTMIEKLYRLTGNIGKFVRFADCRAPGAHRQRRESTKPR